MNHVIGPVSALERLIGMVDSCPWSAHAGRMVPPAETAAPSVKRGIYTPEQRRRRDNTPWTMVQGILAPIQFLVFLISLGLVVRYLATGEGLALAVGSIVIKTLILYAIMVTGSIWERVVFGRYLFATAFFWEDVISVLVMILHTAYLVALIGGYLTVEGQLYLALAAYAAYAVNATQYVVKFRLGRIGADGAQSEEGGRRSGGMRGTGHPDGVGAAG